MPSLEPHTDELTSAMQELSRQFGAAKAEEILRGYQQMATEEEQEASAFEWIESHVGECL